MVVGTAGGTGVVAGRWYKQAARLRGRGTLPPCAVDPLVPTVNSSNRRATPSLLAYPSPLLSSLQSASSLARFSQPCVAAVTSHS